MYDYDVICIGGGPGGSAAAMRCADRGKKVALVEARKKNGVGGTCVNRGCIPTKALMASANLCEDIKNAKTFGVNVSEVSVDLKVVNRRKNTVINQLGFGLENFLLKPRGVDVIKARGKLVDPHTVELDDGKEIRTISAEYIVVAPGSEPANIPAFNIDGVNVITSNEVLDLPNPLPRDILIIGAGVVGLEYGYMLNAFGVKVTIVEMMPNVFPTLHDTQITDAIQAAMEKKGITILTGTGIESTAVQEDGKVLSVFSNGEQIVTEKVLVSIGRARCTKGLGLEELGVEMGKGGAIITDEHMRTNIPSIFASGDGTAAPQLAAVAQRQGLVIAETIAGNDFYINYDAIPSVIFTEPEIASVGLTQADAEGKGINVLCASMPFSSNEKAMAMQRTEGLVKVVARAEDHVIIGAQIFGPEAGTLIGEFTLAVECRLTLENLAFTMHAHPVLSEIIMETCKKALGLAFDRG